MKIQTIVLGALLSFNCFAYDVKTVEIENAFIPPEGFDNNDKIEVVLTGRMPSLCYELGETKLKFEKATKTFELTQLVNKRDYLNCEENQTGLKPRFQQTISLGRLEVGEYKIQYQDSGAYKNFKVSNPANRETIDDNLYAPITSAFIPDFVGTNQVVRVILGGHLEKSCLQFSEQNVETLYYDDVVVVLPKLLINSNDCRSQKKQIQNILAFKNLKVGSYLLHIRTLSGGSINKVFEITSNFPQNH